jgi:polyhydroxyalkanoate synthase
MSALASPDTFVWSRLADAALSVADQIALETHARVERWALDEVPLSGKLVHQLIEWLYREDRFCRGELRIDKPAGPHSVSAPTLAIVNTADDIAPLDSVRPFNESLATPDARIIEYPGEIGVGLQHLGPLIGRRSRARIWPAIISWMEAHRQGSSQTFVSRGRTDKEPALESWLRCASAKGLFLRSTRMKASFGGKKKTSRKQLSALGADRSLLG